MILATLPPPDSPESIGWFCIISASVLVALRQTVALLRSFKDPLKDQRKEDLERINGLSKERKKDSDNRIDALEDAVSECATKEQLTELKLDVHNRLKEMSAYVHEGNHAVTGEIKALYQAGELRGQAQNEAATELNKQNEERASKLHESISAVRLELAADQRSLRSRVDLIAEEMPRKIIELLKSTGHMSK